MTYLEILRHLSDESSFAVDSSEWSRREWMRVKKSAPDLETLQACGETDFPNFGDLQCDGYHAFYQGQPRVKAEHELSDKAAASAHIVRHMARLEEYKRLRTYTVRNQPAATVAVRKMNQVVKDLPGDVKDKMKDQQEKANELGEKENELEALREMWRDLEEDKEDDESSEDGEDGEQGEADGEGPRSNSGAAQKGLEQRGAEVAAEVERLQQQVSEATQELDSAFEENDDEVRAAVRHACKEGVDDIDELNEALSAFGCGSGPGSDNEVPLEDQMKVARMMKEDEQLRWIAEMAGRIDRIIKKSKQEKVASEGGGSIVDVEPTGDLSKLVPSELTRFANPIMKRELMMRLAERSALGYRKERKDKVGKGPIICCVDSSGSMGNAYGLANTAIIWAKATALCLYRECSDRQVPFIYVHFSSGGRVDVKRFDAKPGEELAFMQFSKIFHAGGTDYKLALNACLEQFEEEGMEKADVVFISDGEYPRDSYSFSDLEYKEKMKTLGGKTLGIQIGGYETERPFGDFADASWMLDIDNVRRTGKDAPILKEMFTDFL